LSVLAKCRAGRGLWIFGRLVEPYEKLIGGGFQLILRGLKTAGGGSEVYK
jgi:hypothetical protein